MKFRKLNAIFMVIVMVFVMSGFIYLGPETKGFEEEYAEGRIIVQFEKSMPESAKVENIKAIEALRVKRFEKEGLELIKLEKTKDVKGAIEKLKKMKGIEFAEPDYIVRANYIPDDTYFYLMWGLNNTSNIDIDAPEAWDIERGESSVTVAVIDTGVQTNHPDLAGQFVTGYDFYFDDTSVYDGLDDDHGTHVAGTIAAIDNSIGVIGVAPNIKIMPLKFLGPDGGYISDAIDAINYAKQNGADIINASWGGGGYSESLKNAIESFGGVFVVAAGNNKTDTDKNPYYPASYTSSNIISVAAIDKYGALASFSNYGLNSVDIAAPGVDIASTYPDSYAYMSGTSMAAPHVSGIIALLKSYNNSLTTQELINKLYSTAKPYNSLNGKVKTGGMANAKAALLASAPPIVDTISPLLVSTMPTDASENISINSEVAVNFDENIKWNNKKAVVNGSEFNINVDGKKAIVMLSYPLSYNTEYTVTLSSGAISDLAGNVYSNEVIFKFKTELEPIVQADPIKITRTKPTQGQTGIKLSTDVFFYLNMPITAINSDMIEMKDSQGNTVAFKSYGLNDTKLTIDPTSNLIKQTKYSIILKAGALKSGNSVNSDYTLEFTTGSR